ncbi:hypothetical protein PYCC9005_001083 [Savitreella phatthalungensis]
MTTAPATQHSSGEQLGMRVESTISSDQESCCDDAHGSQDHDSPSSTVMHLPDDDESPGEPSDRHSPVSPGEASPLQPHTPHIGNRLRSVSLNSRFGGRSTANLTQQQMNKKRQRATPEQLVVLEEAFAVNPNPNAKMREAISGEINMTERSVQIWFQNRRAKTKTQQKREGLDEVSPLGIPAHHGLYDIPIRPGIPARSMTMDFAGQPSLSPRGYVPYAVSSPTSRVASGSSLAQPPMVSAIASRQMDMFSAGSVAAMTPHHTLSLAANPAHQPVTNTGITRLNVRSLTIGTWRRVACNAMDLVCYWSQGDPRFTHYINSGAAGFKIEFSIGSVQKIELLAVQAAPGAQVGRMTVKLLEPPTFLMEVSTGGWKHCTDFTENQQASNVLTHTLVGSYVALRESLSLLASAFPQAAALMTIDATPPAPDPLEQHLLQRQMAGVSFTHGPQSLAEISGAVGAAAIAQQHQRQLFAQQQNLQLQREQHQRPQSTSFGAQQGQMDRIQDASADEINVAGNSPSGTMAPASQMSRSSAAGFNASRGQHRRTRSRSAPIAVDFSQFLASDRAYNNYHTGQTSLRMEPYHRDVSSGYSSQQNQPPLSSIVTSSHLMNDGGRYPDFERNESAYSSSATATPSYADADYGTPAFFDSSSNCYTPLPKGPSSMQASVMNSPALMQAGQFDLQMAAAAAAAAGLALSNGEQTTQQQESFDLGVGSTQRQALPSTYLDNHNLGPSLIDELGPMVNQSMPDLTMADEDPEAVQLAVHDSLMPPFNNFTMPSRASAVMDGQGALGHNTSAGQANPLHAPPLENAQLMSFHDGSSGDGLSNETAYARSVAAATAAAGAIMSGEQSSLSAPLHTAFRPQTGDAGQQHELATGHAGVSQLPMDADSMLDFNEMSGLIYGGSGVANDLARRPVGS